MLYLILIQKWAVISRKTAQSIAKLERETGKGRDSINEFDSDISWRLKEEEGLMYGRNKPNP